MTAAEFTRILEELDISGLYLARVMRVDERTIRYWKAGTRSISGTTKVLMQLLDQKMVTPRQLDRLL